jgi:serine/threonine protein kinase
MAEVYLGQHTSLERAVAVKILHSHVAENEALIQRFRSEAQSVSQLRHPNILQVYDFDVLDGHPYMIMEWIAGMPLNNYLRALHQNGGLLPPETTVRLIIGLAAGLDYAHERGIVHRDIKPGNVILRHDHGPIDPLRPLPLDVEPILADFGLAHLSNRAVTVSGELLGTPAYISPEQARGEEVDGRSDIYSLGMMLYEMLAGRLPFESPNETPISLILKQLTASPPAIAGLNPPVQRVLDKALAKDREQRYPRAGEFANELMLALFGREAAKVALSVPHAPLASLHNVLHLLVDQAEAYGRALPSSNYPARAAVTALTRLARQALNEARSLAESLETPKASGHPFSGREFETLKLAAEGLTNKEIAYRLGISERTVQFHMNSIFNKTSTNSRTEAVAFALRHNWIGQK